MEQTTKQVASIGVGHSRRIFRQSGAVANIAGYAAVKPAAQGAAWRE